LGGGFPIACLTPIFDALLDFPYNAHLALAPQNNRPKGFSLADFLNWLNEIVHQVMLVMGYPGIFLLMLVETVFPPIPSEVVMPYAGFLAAQGELHLLGVLTAGTFGSVAGALVLYYAGLRLSEARVRRWIDRWGKYALISARDLNKALHIFDRHGKIAVLVARIIPGARSLISVPAGLKEMPMRTFLVLTIIGTVIWNLVLSVAGYILGTQWEQVLHLLGTYERVIYMALGALLAFYLARRLVKGRQAKASSAARGQDGEAN
jgi:membrane protein DedA with SNARE-associated domain